MLYCYPSFSIYLLFSEANIYFLIKLIYRKYLTLVLENIWPLFCQITNYDYFPVKIMSSFSYKNLFTILVQWLTRQLPQELILQQILNAILWKFFRFSLPRKHHFSITENFYRKWLHLQTFSAAKSNLIDFCKMLGKLNALKFMLIMLRLNIIWL